MKITVCISTYNRPEAYKACIESIKHFTPDHVRIITVDDASDTNYANAGYRFTERVGISTVKNKCLQLAMELDSDQIFLFDDDTYPIDHYWYLHYIHSGQQHLCYTFYKPWKVKNGLNIHRLANGCMMYFTRHCMETVGGFDTNYHSKFEHCDLSRRIYNARLTDNIYQDIQGSDKLIYCLDQDNAVARSFTNREMQDNLKAGYEYFRSREDSSDYIEFRT